MGFHSLLQFINILNVIWLSCFLQNIETIPVASTKFFIPDVANSSATTEYSNNDGSKVMTRIISSRELNNGFEEVTTSDSIEYSNISAKKKNLRKNLLATIVVPYLCDVERGKCWLNENQKNLVTFFIPIKLLPNKQPPTEIEMKEFYSLMNKKKLQMDNSEDPPWNMVIGSGGRELRVSPITETDMYSNLFTAVVHFQYGTPTRKLHFAIRTLVIDIGVVYPGATMTLHIPSFISLPTKGVTFKWHLNKLTSGLPSNMRPSPSGATLRISELRKEQEGTVTCSIYTNLGVQAAKIGFDIIKVESDNNKLVFIATRPPHKSETRKKRSPQSDDNSEYFDDSEDSEPEAGNGNADVYLWGKQRRHLFRSRHLKKRLDDEETSSEEQDDDSVTELDKNEIDDEDGEDELPVVPKKKFHSAKHKQKSYFGDFDVGEDTLFEQEVLDKATPKPHPTRRLSFIERHRQAILERLRENDLKKKPVVEKELLTTPETLKLVDIEEDPSLPPLQERDKLAMLIGKCEKESECSHDAECVKRKLEKPGFCRCLPQFEGNGIFCWEAGKWMI
ncbi:hypothetical protein HNY73_007558 [Argiope bruennichi]|uniref:EGF-like domain-containing protein n=1 Tax=Argiope bruennichi TaxID=94029 RepID=A0A8T0FGV7_ARGBR|nr:hypothetical protein HNY73_007558 [Argiope bruennichi]